MIEDFTFYIFHSYTDGVTIATHFTRQVMMKKLMNQENTNLESFPEIQGRNFFAQTKQVLEEHGQADAKNTEAHEMKR